MADAARAQSAADQRERRFWVGGGLGLGYLAGADDDANTPAAGNLNATYQFSRNIVSARAALAGEIFGDNFFDYGLLYGRSLLQGPLFFSLGAGVAYVDGLRSEGPFGEPEEVDATIGLPLEAQLYLRPLRFVGVGLYGFANVNREESFLGATVSVQVGLLR